MQTIQGFILSRQQQDHYSGQVLRYWLATDRGPVMLDQLAESGVFFVEEDRFSEALTICGSYLKHSKALNLKSFAQKPVFGLYFSHQKHLRKAASLLKDKGILPLEADVRTVDRFLMERFIAASMELKYEESAAKHRFLHIRNGQCKPANYLPQLSCLSFDIETAYPSNRVLSVALYSNQCAQVLMVAESGDPIHDEIQCDVFPDERSLLIAFIERLQLLDPDVLLGWNCINFDLRVLDEACVRYGFKLTLGRNNEALEWRTHPDKPEHYFVLVPGRAVLDGIDMLRTANYYFESYALNYVAQALLGKGKLISQDEHRGEEIVRLYTEDKHAFVAYNLMDCQLVWEIFEQTQLIDFAIERAKLSGLPLDKVGGSVAAFENLYLPRLHRQGYVAPNLPENPQGVGSPGGYVLDSKPGFYDHVLVFDFKSLYPSIIRTFQVDPFALAEGDRLIKESPNEREGSSTLVKGFRGAFFSRHQPILPGLIADLWQAREQAKAKNNKALSHALKIMMNSFYGVMGTPGCRFFDPRLPSSITLRGHEIILKTKQLFEEEGFEVIYGDTDSIFVWLKDNVPLNDIEALGKQLVGKINRWWREYLRSEWQLTSALELEFENHYRRFLMPTIRGSSEGSKKRYAGLVCGDKGNELIFKGLETVRSDWTPLAREFQKHLYTRIFLNQDYQTYVMSILDDLKQGKLDAQLVFRKRLRRPLAEYQKNIPPQVNAAIKADAFWRAQGKPLRYQRGGWIRYFYTLNGPEPEECLQSALDYDLYIERQIAPIADGILTFIGSSFEQLTTKQLNLL